MGRARQIDEETLGTFARNLRRVIGAATVNAWAAKHELTQSTVNRIVTGDMDPTASVMERVAAAIGMATWQMLVPDMDPQNPPVIRDATDAERKLYARLKATLDELAEIREGGNTRPSSLDAHLERNTRSGRKPGNSRMGGLDELGGQAPRKRGSAGR